MGGVPGPDPARRRWREEPGADEVALASGDVTPSVVRAGATVRRTTGPHSAYVHAVLDHLETAGFDGAPRFLGVDEQGREVLTYVEGEVADRPLPAWVADEDRLVSLARLLRRHDDAATGFVPPPGVRCHVTDAVPADLPPGPPEPPTLVGHLDVTPENVVWRDGEAVALIDFDLARPATRVDEVHNALLWWAPLADPRDRDQVQRDLDVPRRCRLFADAYGLDDDERARLTATSRAHLRRSWHLMRHRALTEGGGWRRLWDDGIGDSIRRRGAWLDAAAGDLDRALLAGRPTA